MNATDTNVGGWSSSSMRTYVNGTIYESLPKEIKDNIIITTVVSGLGSTSEEKNFTSDDKLYLLSSKEVYGSSALFDNLKLTRQLDYYKIMNASLTKYTNVVKYLDKTKINWWLRSAYSLDDRSFYFVRSDGSNDQTGARTTDTGISPAFRIG